MDASDLALLDVIIIEGGITAAAQKLGQPKTTVSRRLRMLEQAVGAALFERSGRRLRLTPLGQAFAMPAQDVRAAVSAAQSLARTGASDNQGLLRMSAPVLFGNRVLVPFVGTFARGRPEVIISLTYSQTPVDPLRDGFDLSFSVLRPPAPYLTVQKLVEYDIALFAAPDLAGKVRSPADLRGIPAIVTSNTVADVFLWTLAEGVQTHEVTARARVTVNDPGAAGEFVAAGLGIGGLPVFLAAELVATGKIVPVLPGMTIGRVAIYVSAPPLRTQIPVVKTFLSELRQAVRTLPSGASR